MPIEFAVHRTAGYFVAKWCGRITDDEMVPAYERFGGSHDWTPDLQELTDLSESDMSQITAEGVRELVKSGAQHYTSRGVRHVACAIFAPKDLPFGLGRMYAALAEASPESVRVFRHRDEAERWLTERSTAAE